MAKRKMTAEERLEALVRRARRVEQFLHSEDSPLNETSLAEAALTLAFLGGMVAARTGLDAPPVLGAVAAGHHSATGALKAAGERLGSALATGDAEEIAKAASEYGSLVTGLDLRAVMVGDELKADADPAVAGKVDEALDKILSSMDGKES
jgi:hypothetical protein